MVWRHLSFPPAITVNAIGGQNWALTFSRAPFVESPCPANRPGARAGSPLPRFFQKNFLDARGRPKWKIAARPLGGPGVLDWAPAPIGETPHPWPQHLRRPPRRARSRGLDRTRSISPAGLLGASGRTIRGPLVPPQGRRVYRQHLQPKRGAVVIYSSMNDWSAGAVVEVVCNLVGGKAVADRLAVANLCLR
jgi:hypothetical protein